MKALALLALSFALPVFAQDCASTIIDPGNLLGSQVGAVTIAANKLVQMGVDPHVVVDDPPVTPEMYVAMMHQRCQAWKSASGGVKNNLVVFLVYPRQHKVDIESGSEYAKAIDFGSLKMNYMAPSFRDKDWAMGMIKGMNQAAIQIQAHQEAALHPAVVTQQATDLHGLWTVMGWGVGILVVCGGIWLIFYMLGKRNATRDAQQNAVNARNDAAKRLQDLRNWVETKEALSVPVAAARASLDAASEDFANVSSSETYNPNTKALSAGQYTAIARRYESIRDAARTANVNTASTENYVRIRSHGGSHRNTAAPSSTPAPNTGSTRTVIHEHYNDTTVIAPVIIEEAPYYAPEPVRESHYTPDPEPVSSWSGGSSSFSSDSDDNSSSGGSSDFGGDGGGFDGGGGSDF